MPRPRILIIVTLSLAVLLGVLYIANRLAGTYLWFGSPPPPADYAAQLHALTRKASGLDAQVAGAPAPPDSWPLYQQIIDLVIDSEGAITGAEVRQTDGTLRFTVDYTAPATKPHDSEPARLAVLVLEEHDRRGLADLLDRLGLGPAAARPQGTTGKLFTRATHDLSAARQLVRAEAARFAIAHRAGDDSGALAHLRRGLAIAHVLGHQPTLIEHMTGTAAAAFMFQTVREELVARRPSDATARAILSLLEPNPVAPIHVALDGDRIIGLDMLYATLPDSPIKAASRGAQMEKLEEVYGILIPYARQSRSQRSPQTTAQINALGTGLGGAFAATDILIPAIGKSLQSADQWLALHDGTILMVAVEAYAAAHGAPPQTLNELVPGILPSLLQDPFSPKGFVYRVLPPGQDPVGRGYVLYSVGADGADDGGKTHDKGAHTAFTRDGSGFDAVINAPRE